MQQLLHKIMPFVMLGIALVAFVFGIIIIAYLFFFGSILGLILYAANWVREKYVMKKPPTRPKPGRTIDSDDWRVL